MKARLLRDELITHPDLKSFADIARLGDDYHAGRLTREQYQNKLQLTAKAGTVIDHPEAHLLVAMGIAEPVDIECKNRANCIMRGNCSLDEKIVHAAEVADKLIVGQSTGIADVDATDEQAEALRANREKRLSESGG